MSRPMPAQKPGKRDQAGTTPPPKAGTRQLNERLLKGRVKADAAPSWWVGLSREELDAGSRARADRMQHSREARFALGNTNV